jgi:hypothetical protein
MHPGSQAPNETIGRMARELGVEHYFDGSMDGRSDGIATGAQAGRSMDGRASPVVSSIIQGSPPGIPDGGSPDRASASAFDDSGAGPRTPLPVPLPRQTAALHDDALGHDGLGIRLVATPIDPSSIGTGRRGYPSGGQDG